MAIGLYAHYSGPLSSLWWFWCARAAIVGRHVIDTCTYKVLPVFAAGSDANLPLRFVLRNGQDTAQTSCWQALSVTSAPRSNQKRSFYRGAPPTRTRAQPRLPLHPTTTCPHITRPALPPAPAAAGPLQCSAPAAAALQHARCRDPCGTAASICPSLERTCIA